MAKMTGPCSKGSRRLGLNARGRPKAMKRVVKGTARLDKKLTEYDKQLLEKQRLRAYYSVMEKQFANYFLEAKKSKEQAGPALVKILETCLDNITYRMGFASSIRQARQMVTHGHMFVSSKEVGTLSHRLSAGDEVALAPRGKKADLSKDNHETNFVTSYPYISRDKSLKTAFSAEINREDTPAETEDQLIVEFYPENM